MGQIDPLTRRALEVAERVHDTFDAAVADRVLTAAELNELRYELDLAVWSCCVSDTAQANGQYIQRGGFGRERQDRMETAWEQLMAQRPIAPATIIDLEVTIDLRDAA